MNNLYVAYSRLNRFWKCPKLYALNVAKVPESNPIDPYYFAFGAAFQKMMENFYNTYPWMEKPQEATTWLREEWPIMWEKYSCDPRINWDRELPENKDQLRDVGYNCIGITRDVIVKYQLLAPGAISEKQIKYEMDGVLFDARPDFIVPKQSGIWILDGKGGRSNLRYVDENQLLFYCLIHKLCYKEPIEALAFWAWRTGELKFVDLNKLPEFAQRVAKTIELMKGNNFPPRKDSSECNDCVYRDYCARNP